MADEFNPVSIALSAITLLVVGGVSQAILSGFIEQLSGMLQGVVTGLWMIIFSMATLFFLHKSYKKGGAYSFINLIPLIGVAVGAGAMFSAFIPQLETWFFNPAEITWTGLVSTLFYVALANLAGDYIREYM